MERRVRATAAPRCGRPSKALEQATWGLVPDDRAITITGHGRSRRVAARGRGRPDAVASSWHTPTQAPGAARRPTPHDRVGSAWSDGCSEARACTRFDGHRLACFSSSSPAGARRDLAQEVRTARRPTTPATPDASASPIRRPARRRPDAARRTRRPASSARTAAAGRRSGVRSKPARSRPRLRVRVRRSRARRKAAETSAETQAPDAAAPSRPRIAATERSTTSSAPARTRRVPARSNPGRAEARAAAASRSADARRPARGAASPR